MNAKEHIAHEPGNPDAWVCICKNEPSDDGFYPCNEQGDEVNPIAGWDGLYVCNRCGRIIRQETLEVLGRRASALATPKPLGEKKALVFPVLGTIYSTPGAQKAIEESGESISSFLTRCLRGDWGDCGEEDWKSNDEAVTNDGRILAVYHT